MSDIGDELLEALKGGDNDSELLKVLGELLDLDKNLFSKTDLSNKEIKKIALALTWSEIIKKYSKRAENIITYFIIVYCKLKVSKNRMGRKEIISAIKSKLSEKEDEKLSKMLKLLGG